MPCIFSKLGIQVNKKNQSYNLATYHPTTASLQPVWLHAKAAAFQDALPPHPTSIPRDFRSNEKQMHNTA
jgi:hypothetical protein